MIGSVGQVVFDHADAEVAQLTETLRAILATDGTEALHQQIREVEQGIQVIEQTIDYQSDDELGPFPYSANDALKELENQEVTPVLQLDHQHQFPYKNSTVGTNTRRACCH